ncbi:MAG: hypothetical protein LUE12_01555 [Ruminococcus sp.]|nr:hypothetical protein [Ruminococcus sp.]
MDIRLLSDSCAKIKLSSNECEELGISYYDFSPDSISARIFLASVLARLEDMGAQTMGADKITAEIFEQYDGGLIIYISGEGFGSACNEAENTCEFAIKCKTPQELIAAAAQIPENAECELYKLDGSFVLICSDFLACASSDIVEIAKIREYATLISDTPIALIRKITDD